MMAAMATTQTPRFGVHQYSAGTDEPTRGEYNADMAAIEELAAIAVSGLDADLPDPGEFGRFYLATDLSANHVNRLRFDAGAAWVSISTSASTPGGMLRPVQWTDEASPTSTGAEVLDTALGTYQFTAVSGRSYTIKAPGHHATSDTGGDDVRVLIRDSQDGTDPVNTDLVLQSSAVHVPAGGAKCPVPLEVTLDCPARLVAGVHTIGVFVDRLTGTGAAAVTVAVFGRRQLYAVDEGVHP